MTNSTSSTTTRNRMARFLRKSVLLNLDFATVKQIDDAARLMNITRTAFIRESIFRNLGFFERSEKAAHLRIRDQAYK